MVAPVEARLNRWEAHGGDPEDARRRMAAQISRRMRSGVADDVIVNDGALQELKEKVKEICPRSVRLAD